MKIRTDFVTNSSSACYTVEFQLKSDLDDMVSCTVVTNDGGTEFEIDYDGREMGAKDTAKALTLGTPSVWGDDIVLSGMRLPKAESLEEITRHMMGMVTGELYEGDYASGNTLLPNAAKALANACAKKGITKENLRIIGGKICVTPFGDSVWEVDDYCDQWGINVQTGELEHTGKNVTRYAGDRYNQGDIYDADTSWQDTVWWPFTGKTHGVPYEQAITSMEQRKSVRHLNLSGLDVTRYDTSKSENAKNRYSQPGIFGHFEDLQSLDLSGLDTSRLTSMEGMFGHCTSLRSIDLSCLNTSQVTNMSHLFQDCWGLRSVDLAGIDTSQVTTMTMMFYDCEQLPDVDVTSLNTSQVESMSSMFSDCKSLTELDVSHFDTSKVQTMARMFMRCERLSSLDLSNFDTSRVEDMARMFYGCYELQELDLSGFDTARVTDMSDMFDGCIGLYELNISGLCTAQVTNMDAMFYNCNRLHKLDVSSFDTSQVTDMSDMFARCKCLQALDLSHFNTAKVRNVSRMFDRCRSLKSLDLSSFDGSHITYTDEVFNECESLERWSVSATWPVHFRGAIPAPKHNGAWWSTRDGVWMSEERIRERGPVADTYTATRPLLKSLVDGLSKLTLHPDAVPYEQVLSNAVDKKKVRHIDLSGIDATELTSMESMFEHCEKLVSLRLSRLNTSRVTNMSNAFSECYSIKRLDVSKFDTSQVTDMSWMFNDCYVLADLDVSGFDTSRVTNMRCMFADCNSLQHLDVTGFDTSRVNDTVSMFSNCHALEHLDVSGFDTSQVTKMDHMFYACRSLEQLDVTSLDTSKATSMVGMFSQCTSLKTINLSSFDTSQVTDMDYLFFNCTSLEYLDLSSFDTSKIKSVQCMFSGCRSLKTLDLSSFDLTQVSGWYMNSMFDDCESLERWTIPDAWPLQNMNAIPMPTAVNGRWWSEHDGTWMTVEQIRERGPMADTFTSTASEVSPPAEYLEEDPTKTRLGSITYASEFNHFRVFDLKLNHHIELMLKSDKGNTATFEMSTESACAYPPDEDGFDASSVPHYYEGIDPFRALFRYGWPVKALDLYMPTDPTSLLQAKDIKEIVTSLFGYVGVRLNPYGNNLNRLGFLIAGEPSAYGSREELEETIKSNNGRVTNTSQADFVILCGDAKKRFCERWPLGYSWETMDDEEDRECSDASGNIQHIISVAAEAMDDDLSWWNLYDGSPDDFQLFEDLNVSLPDGWDGWALVNYIKSRSIPILDEEEFAFFDPKGPAAHGTPSAMPGAAEAFLRKCSDTGIIKDNLRIVGARICVASHDEDAGDAYDYSAQWCLSMQTGKTRDTDEWTWQDGTWWPPAD